MRLMQYFAQSLEQDNDAVGLERTAKGLGGMLTNSLHCPAVFLKKMGKDGEEP